MVIILGQPFARFSEARDGRKKGSRSNKPMAIKLRKEHVWDLNCSRRKGERRGRREEKYRSFERSREAKKNEDRAKRDCQPERESDACMIIIKDLSSRGVESPRNLLKLSDETSPRLASRRGRLNRCMRAGSKRATRQLLGNYTPIFLRSRAPEESDVIL